MPLVWSEGKKGEDLTIQAYKQGVQPQSNLPSRPDYGATGTQVVLRTNYFHLLPDEKCTIFKYTVTIDLHQAANKEKGEKELSTRKKRQCFELLLKDPFFALSLPAVATDYESSILTCKKLALADGETKGFDITYVDPQELAARPGTKPIRMFVKFSHQVPVSDLLKYLKTPHASTTFNADMLQQTRNDLQTVIVRQANTKGENVSGSKNTKYYPWIQGGACTESYRITPGIIALKGYFVSIRSSTMRVLTNVNVCTSAFYEHGNLAEIMKAILQQENFQVTPRLMQWITGLRVRRIDTEEPKVKVIHGICASDANRYMIDLQGGKTIDGRSRVSVKRYFEVEHTYTIMNPNLPLIDVGSKDGTPACYLPAEVLEVLPGQAYRKKLRDNDEIKMSKIGVRPPAANAERITNAVKGVLNLHPQLEVLRSFKVRVLPEMLAVVGRILQAPRLMYSQTTFTPQDAKWDITNKKLSIPARIDRWTFLSVETGGSFHQDTFYPVLDFIKALRNFGLTIGDPDPYNGYQVKVRDNDDQNIDQQIKAELTKISKLKPQLLLVTLGSKSSAIYSRLKYLADTVFGIHTVCCTRKTMLGGQAFANMALKVNLKFGGVNQRLPPTDIGCLKGGSTMIIGIDVTHPALGSMENTSSIAAVVGSIDDDFAQWPASLRLQASRQEIVAEIGSMFGERLDAWQTAHKGALPKKIVIYRDGVSDSQYDKVINAEIDEINKIRLKTYGNTRGSELIMIIGAKRHHTRFFPTVVNNRRIMDTRTGNCKPGTVVDRGITMEKGWDFYLQAHGALKGTAKPAHYIVVYTEFGPELTVDKVEQMVSPWPPLKPHYLALLIERPYRHTTSAISSVARRWLSRSVRRRTTPTWLAPGDVRISRSICALIKTRMSFVSMSRSGRLCMVI